MATMIGAKPGGAQEQIIAFARTGRSNSAVELRKPEAGQLPTRPEEDGQKEPVHPRRSISVFKHGLPSKAGLIFAANHLSPEELVMV